MGSQVTITPDEPSSTGPVTITPDPPGLLQRIKTWATTPGPLQENQSKPTEMPGSFEGHPENVGEYVPATVGEAAGGVKDVARGNIARGAHRILSGAMNATLPALPFVAAGAPIATAAAMATGTAGQQIGKRGAQALGATEDQSDLAGDVTGLASGYGGTKLPAGKIAASMKVLASPAAEAAAKLPVVDKVVSAGRALGKYKNVPGELADVWKAKQADVQTPKPIQRGSLSQLLQQQLNEGLGAAPPPNPKAPIYQRGQLSSAMQEGSDVPQGHTAVEGSSAIRSKMYDPEAREFHARLTSGDTTYVYGDVSPEEASGFEGAKSKGQAFQAMKANHPLVAKIVNGKRIAVKGSIEK